MKIYIGYNNEPDLTKISLQDLLEYIPQLQKKYGKRAVLEFDAGYYNISVSIEPTKKVKKENA